ncbi:19489_t:CDS:1, partial [Racocetra persica]
TLPKKPVTALTLAKRPGTGSTHLQRASKNPKAYCDTLIQASKTYTWAPGWFWQNADHPSC